MDTETQTDDPEVSSSSMQTEVSAADFGCQYPESVPNITGDHSYSVKPHSQAADEIPDNKPALPTNVPPNNLIGSASRDTPAYLHRM